MKHPVAVKAKKLGSKERAAHAARFFKTGPGQYGEGDIFWGLNAATTESLAKSHSWTLPEISDFLHSEIHELRTIGVIALVNLYDKAKTPADKTKIFNFYVQHFPRVNNWDLVDGSAYWIAGPYCDEFKKTSLLKKFARSKHMWTRRVGIVATLHFSRLKQTQLAFDIAKILLKDEHDLMHKSVGWMLREAGKRDLPGLRKFLAQHSKVMPRTMLRYSIEKMTPAERKKWMS